MHDSPHWPDKPLDLRSRIRRSVGLTLTSLALTALGILMIDDGAAAGWFVALFFGLCTVVAVVALIRPGRLTLNQKGMVVTNLGRTMPLIEWRHCDNFRPWSPSPAVAGAQLVAFDYTGPLNNAAERVAWTFVGGMGALPDTYGRSAADLSALLTEKRRKALQGPGAEG